MNKENSIDNVVSSVCKYVQVVQQTFDEKFEMYDKNTSNEKLIEMIVAQDDILKDFGYKIHNVDNLKTYERRTLIEIVIRGGELLDLCCKMSVKKLNNGEQD